LIASSNTPVSFIDLYFFEEKKRVDISMHFVNDSKMKRRKKERKKERNIPEVVKIQIGSSNVGVVNHDWCDPLESVTNDFDLFIKVMN
jgi:hypothetical protein